MLKTSNNLDQQSHNIKLTISNIGNKINKGTLYPTKGTSFDVQPTIIIDDSRWLTGSIFGYDI